MEILCGVDEAGRGPIAGPVTAAAVILPEDFPCDMLDDSKKLSPLRRNHLLPVILAGAVDVGIGWAGPGEIDLLNIHRATLLAMQRALSELKNAPSLVLVDGKFVPESNFPIRAVVGGDRSVPQIQAASICAKVVRDRWMERYSWIEPHWRFEKHKGYPTEEHRRLCSEYGLSVIHRRSFRIVYPS